LSLVLLGEEGILWEEGVIVIELDLETRPCDLREVNHLGR
jgi:hypothetical protein